MLFHSFLDLKKNNNKNKKTHMLSTKLIKYVNTGFNKHFFNVSPKNSFFGPKFDTKNYKKNYQNKILHDFFIYKIKVTGVSNLFLF